MKKLTFPARRVELAIYGDIVVVVVVARFAIWFVHYKPTKYNKVEEHAIYRELVYFKKPSSATGHPKGYIYAYVS